MTYEAFPEPPDDGTTPAPTYRRYRPSARKRPLSTEGRAPYWRAFKRKQKLNRAHAQKA